MTATTPRVAYQLDRAAVTAAEADWLAELPSASPRKQNAALRRLRANAARTRTSRGRLHLTGMGLASLGLPGEAVGVFIRASELDPTTTADVVNAAVAMVHTGDLERARLWLAPVAQANGELSAVAREFMAEIDRAQESRELPAQTGPGAATAPDTETATERTAELLDTVTHGGPQANDALNSLRHLVHQEPGNEYYRHTLMFALLAHSDTAAALTQAELLESRPDPTHERHFNLAQAFWFCGERQRAHNHFELAYQLAETDEERQDVVAMLEYLREQDAQEVDED